MENLKVLYEDNHLIGVYKPPGILVQGDSSGNVSLLDVTRHYIKEKYGKPGNVFLGLVHRLDRPVSGVVLFARTTKGASRISLQIRSRQMIKIYLAKVQGRMHPQDGTLIGYIKRHSKGFSQIVREKTEGVQEAALSYKTLRIGEEASLLEIDLHTGRKHQIRAQLAAAGCPIQGDLKYGASHPLENGFIRLFAKSLTFRHPTRSGIITIEAPLPDWAQCR